VFVLILATEYFTWIWEFPFSWVFFGWSTETPNEGLALFWTHCS